MVKSSSEPVKYTSAFVKGYIIHYLMSGFDHGVGHSLLLLYDAKAPRGQKSKEFNDLGHDLSNAFISLF